MKQQSPAVAAKGVEEVSPDRQLALVATAPVAGQDLRPEVAGTNWAVGEINKAIQADPSIVTPHTLNVLFLNLLANVHAELNTYGGRLDFNRFDQEAQIKYFLAKTYSTHLLEDVFGMRVVADRPISSSIREAKELLEEEKNAGSWAIALRAAGEIISGKPAKTRTEIIKSQEELGIICEDLEAKISARTEDLLKLEISYQARATENSQQFTQQLNATNTEIAKAWGEFRANIAGYEEKITRLARALEEKELYSAELDGRINSFERRLAELEDHPIAANLKELVTLMSAKFSETNSEKLARLLSQLGITPDLIKDLTTPPPALSRQSVIDLCGYRQNPDGFNTFHLPKGMSLIQLFEMANAECERLGINPAVYTGDFEWWSEEANGSEIRSEDLGCKIMGLTGNTLSKSRNDQGAVLAKKSLRFAEAAAVENILTHIATRGKVDSFSGKWARTVALGVTLSRVSSGLSVGGRHDFHADSWVGAAASPK